MLDAGKPHLHQRWNEGCTNIQQLHREVKALGFRGSYATVYAYLAPFQGTAAPPAVPGPPKVRHITSWIRRCPGNLDAGEQLKLTQVRAACPHPYALRGYVEEFAKMLTGRRGERLDAWIAAVRADDLPYLHTFANGLERDHAAVPGRADAALLIWPCRGQSLQDQIPQEAHVRPGQLRPAEEDGTAQLKLCRDTLGVTS